MSGMSGMSLWKKAAGGAAGSSRNTSGIEDDDPDTVAYHEMLKKTNAAAEDEFPKRKSIRFAQGIESSNSAKGKKSAFGRIGRASQPLDFEGLGDDDEDDDMLIENDPDESLEIRGAKSKFGHFGHTTEVMGEDFLEEEVRMRWNTKDLCELSSKTSYLSMFTTGIIAIVDHFNWYKYDSRMTEVTVTYWIAAIFIGGLGVYAANKRRTFLVSLHIALGFMLGACLGTYSVSIHYNMETRCDTMQAAFAGCGGCECSWTNSCSAQNLTEISSCRRCEAWPVEICRVITIGFGNGLTLTSIMGAVALLFISVPVTINLIMLVRMENVTGEAFKSKIGLDVVQLEEQLEYMMKGEEPTIRPSALDLLIDRVKERGMNILAGKAEAAMKVLKAHKKPPKMSLRNVAKLRAAPAMGMLMNQAYNDNASPQRKYEMLDEDDEDVDADAVSYKTPAPKSRAQSGRSSDRYYAAAAASPKAMGYIPTPSAKGSPSVFKGKEPETPGGHMSRFYQSGAQTNVTGGSSRVSDPGSDFDLDF